jgi:hypothetical protein
MFASNAILTEQSETFCVFNILCSALSLVRRDRMRRIANQNCPAANVGWQTVLVSTLP